MYHREARIWGTDPNEKEILGTPVELRTGESHISAGYKGGTLAVQCKNKIFEMARKITLDFVNLKLLDY